MRIPTLAIACALTVACSGGDTDTKPADTSPTTGPSDTDADADGVLAAVDCDDADPDVGGPVEWYVDNDGDGYGVESATTRVD
jgi:hypothetical protein